jgi:hypothetical protein
MPLAVFLTRYSDVYELLHAALAIPVGLAFGAGAVAAARSVRRLDERMLGRADGIEAARAGRVLGLIGICLAGTAAVAVGVYGLLELAGTRA